MGFHHVTAFAGDAQPNLDFYRRFLGLTLVKRTVNFDDPAMYHFYFGDACGTPGQLATFFPWPAVFAGRRGSGMASGLSLAISKNDLGDWIDRAKQAHVACSGPGSRFGEELITLCDPAGLPVELIAGSDGPMRLHSATLWESDTRATSEFLSGVMGFQRDGEERGRARWRQNGAIIDVVEQPAAERARLSLRDGASHRLPRGR